MKQFGILCLIFIVLAVVLPVTADSVWVPMDDYFEYFWSRPDDSLCQYMDRRTFMAAGENGYAAAVKTPLDQTVEAIYPNGTEFMVDFFCGVGDDLWGTIHSFRYPGESTFTAIAAWETHYIAKKDLVQAFDTDSFSALNADSIEAYTEEFNPCEPRFPFAIWSYPYSGVQLSLVSEHLLERFCDDHDSYNPYTDTVDRIYYAPDGTRWLSFHYSDKSELYGWLNLDHPMDGAIEQTY